MNRSLIFLASLLFTAVTSSADGARNSLPPAPSVSHLSCDAGENGADGLTAGKDRQTFNTPKKIGAIAFAAHAVLALYFLVNKTEAK